MLELTEICHGNKSKTMIAKCIIIIHVVQVCSLLGGVVSDAIATPHRGSGFRGHSHAPQGEWFQRP